MKVANAISEFNCMNRWTSTNHCLGLWSDDDVLLGFLLGLINLFSLQFDKTSCNRLTLVIFILRILNIFGDHNKLMNHQWPITSFNCGISYIWRESFSSFGVLDLFSHVPLCIWALIKFLNSKFSGFFPIQHWICLASFWLNKSSFWLKAFFW